MGNLSPGVSVMGVLPHNVESRQLLEHSLDQLVPFTSDNVCRHQV